MAIGLLDGDSVIWRFGWIDDAGIGLSKLSQFIDEHQERFQLNEMKILLGDDVKSNFRYKIYPEYKATRKDTKRPPNEKLIREYLFDQYNAIKIKGAEVDDALGIYQCKCIKNKVKSIIFTNDKDLDMIPGWHCDLDFRREVQYKDRVITRRSYKDRGVYKVKDPGFLKLGKQNDKSIIWGGGQLWFCAQMLLGDSSDNIPSISKLTGKRLAGNVTVYNLLKDCKTYKDALYLVYKQYIDNLPKEVANKAFKRNAKLLWIKRSRGKENIYDERWLT